MFTEVNLPTDELSHYWNELIYELTWSIIFIEQLLCAWYEVGAENNERQNQSLWESDNG